ncbi:DUF6538 domain-containing protein [Sulfitobacter sp. BSw21498]|uniref:DUF6538 domain-containing protein n=1 Tax=Sulfitobacter sp. BSw21498 TaxID=664426 RepID=UPI003F8EF006
MRRGRMFYFRKRLPACISKFGSNQFICLSLRTHLPLDAVKRAARLLSVYEKKELDCPSSGFLGPMAT